MLSYAAIVNAPQTLTPVIQQLGLNMTPNQLASQVAATSDLGTVILTVSVTGPDPQFVKSVANAVANQFTLTVSSIEIPNLGTSGSPVKATVVKYADAPATPISPKKANNYLGGLVAGLAFSLLIIYLLQYFDDTVKSIDELGSFRVLGSVQKEQPKKRTRSRSKSKSLFGNQVELETKSEFHEIALKIKLTDNEQIIGVSPAWSKNKHHSFAFELAKTFASNGFSAVFVDAVFRQREPNNLDYRGEEFEFGLLNLLEPSLLPVDWNSIQYKVINTQTANLAILPHGKLFLESDFNSKLPTRVSQVLDNLRLEATLETLANHFDYVIVDCDSYLGGIDASVTLRYCDGAILLYQYGQTRESQISRIESSIGDLKISMIGSILLEVPKQLSSPEQYSSTNKGKSRIPVPLKRFAERISQS
jgi:Mrp family chromosome partitioning ATPase